MVVSQDPGQFAYQTLFFYHRLANRSAYPWYIDNKLVELPWTMFLQGPLVFFIRCVLKLMYNSHVYLCYKSNIF